MKKITQFSIIALIFLITGACSNKFENELFDSSPTERVQKSIADLKKRLVAAPDGWAFEYFPGGKEREAQGNMYALKFTDTHVMATLDIAPANLALTSTYAVKPNDGVTLSFDEYNPLLHHFAEPTSGSYNGQLADFEFSLVSQTDDVITLKGKKYHSLMRLIKLSESPESFMNKVREISGYIKNRGFADLSVNGKEIKFIQPKNVILSYTDENQNEKTIATTYLYTDKGIRFYAPITINEVTFQELTLNRDTNSLTSEDGKTILGMFFPAPFDLETSSWYTVIKNSSMSSEAFTQLFDQLDALNNEKLKEHNLDLSLSRVIEFGGSYKGIHFFSSLKSNPLRGFGTTYELKFNGGKKAGELNISLLKAGQNWNFFSHLAPLRDLIVNNAPYQTELDDPTNPTNVKLISTKKPDIWFVLSK